MSEIKSTEFILSVKIGTGEFKAVARSRSYSLDVSRSKIDTTTLDSGEWETGVPGNMSWSGSADGVIIRDDSKLNYEELLTAMVGTNNPVVLRFKDGSVEQSGTAIITSLNQTANKDDILQFSMSFEGTGPLVTAKVSSGD